MRKIIASALALFVVPFTGRCAGAEIIQLQANQGVYSLPVQINGTLTLNLVFDSGSSLVVLPEDVFQNLKRGGTVKSEDVRGPTTSMLANGAKIEGHWLVLRSVAIGKVVVYNVIASVVPAGTAPLLGQSFLGRLPGWSIDNNRHVLILDKEAWGWR